MGKLRLPSTEPPANASDIELTVARVEFTGSTVYSRDVLEQLSAPLLHRPVRLLEIYALAQAVTAHYGRDGYVLSRAIVPPQSLSPKAATVRLEIVEGFVDEVVWPEAVKARYRDFFSHYAARITSERPVNIKTIERYLLLAGDLPGLKFTSVFKPSASQPRAATLVVTAQEKLLAGEIGIDNRGSQGRGPWQAQTAGTASNWLGTHEALTLRYASAVPSHRELQFLEGTWRQVLSAEGLSLTVQASYNTGIPGLAPLQALEYESVGKTASLQLTYPLVRSRDENLSLSGIVFATDITSTALDVPLTDDRLRGLRARLDYDRGDSLAGVNLVQLTLNQGIKGLGSTDKDNPLASRIGGDIDFTKAELTLARIQSFGALVPGLSLYAAFNGQFAADALLSAEQCSYGGKAYGRAFDPSALVGDHCAIGLAELRYDIAAFPWMSHNQLFAYVDQGYTERVETSLGTPSSAWGRSAGGGLRLGWKEHVSATLEASRGIGGDIDQGWRGRFDLTVRY